MTRYSFIILLLFTSILYSQKNEYLINAEFNVLEKSINIQQSLKFNNNTGINLNEIFINDWANSYSNANSPLGKRLSEEYSLSFQRSTKNQRGRTIINEIYNDENKVLSYQRLPLNIDIIKINLDKTLKPGESIYLYFNYQTIIPESDFTKYGISKENDVNIRDWFLTVSKFVNGTWLTESNLDLNDLSIDPSEFKFIISYPLDYVLVSNLPVLSKYKTNISNIFESKKEVRMNTSILMQKNSLFKEYKIGDNIVITDLDNYIIKQDSLINNVIGYVDLKLGDKLMLNKLKGTNINLDSIINKTFSYVESKLGDYPFKKIILSKHNQSRKPIYGLNNIPNIINPFDESFLFEFNFLKLILTSYLSETLSIHNRKNYWENEGVVTYLMIDYIENYYPNLKLIGKYSELSIIKNRIFSKYSFNEQYRLFENIISSRNINQPVLTSLDSLTRVNQKIINPYKTGLGFQMLSQYLGNESVDLSIKEYVRLNSLNNINYVSFQQLFKLKNNSSKWFFNDYLKSKSKGDYSIKKISSNKSLSTYRISKSNEIINFPTKLSFTENNKIIDEKWLMFKNNDTIVSFKYIPNTFIEINKNKFVSEKSYKNNITSFDKFKKPIKFVLFNDFDNPKKNQIYYMPLVNYNLYDGLMPGLRLSNATPIFKPFTYRVSPYFSSKQNKVLGKLNFKFVKYHTNKKLFSSQYFLGASTFHYKDNLSYTTFFPSLTLTFRENDLRSNRRQFINVRYVSVYREENNNQKENPNYNILNARYVFTNNTGEKGLTFITNLQYSKKFLKNTFTLKFRKYYKNNRQYNIRLFLGKFLYNSTVDDYYSFSTYRSRDYMYNYNLLGRSESTGFFSQQYIGSEGALKSKVNPDYSNDMLLSINTGVTLWQWVEAYYDYAIVKNKNIKTKFVYDSGIRLNLLTDYFELYFPFYSSLGNELSQPNYLEKIRFKISLNPSTISGLISRRWF
jgi:hypothetical protein